MPTDKKISELPIASLLKVSDISVLVDGETDYQYSFTLLLQFLAANLSIGAAISFGTTLPQNINGNNGDVFINTSTGSFIQKISGSWIVVYNVLSANAADGTLLFGTGAPSSATGKNSDSYIDTLTGIFYKKSSDNWAQVFSIASGPAGPRGNSLLNGSADPLNNNGTNGDFYLNTITKNIFGPKAGGIWPIGVSIAPLTPNTILNGTTNPSNTLGNNGDFYLDITTFTLFGPKSSNIWPTGVSLIAAGLPSGGNANQILSKVDSNDFNTEWVNQYTGLFSQFVKADGSYSILLSADVATALGYVAENVGSKVTALDNSAVSYPSTSAIVSALNNYMSLTGGSFTGDVQQATMPVNGFSLINKNYVDSLVTGITWKQEVKAGTTSNIILSGTQTIDGVTLTANDRVLVKNQTIATQNGIYAVQSSVWNRTDDTDTSSGVGSATVLVRNGSTLKNTQWTCTNSTDPVIGTDNITFGQISGAGTYSNGTGILLTGNVFSLDRSYSDGLYPLLGGNNNFTGNNSYAGANTFNNLTINGVLTSNSNVISAGAVSAINGFTSISGTRLATFGTSGFAIQNSATNTFVQYTDTFIAFRDITGTTPWSTYIQPNPVPISTGQSVSLFYPQVNGLLATTDNITNAITGLAVVYFNKAGDTLTAADGTGFFGMLPQSVVPSTPTAGTRIYASSVGAFSWVGVSGFTKTFSGLGLSANRIYTLPDFAGTLLIDGTTYSNPTWLTSLAQTKISYVGSNLQYVAGNGSYITFPTNISTFTNNSGYLTNTTGDARYLQLTGGILTGYLTLNADPVSSLQAVTKNYADNIITGFVGGSSSLSPFQRVTTNSTGGLIVSPNFAHPPVKYATAAVLPSYTYNNGTGGVGATLTATANGALTVDGNLPIAGETILVFNENANLSYNGIYVCTQPGSSTTPYILTRTTFGSIGANMTTGSSVYVYSGSTLQGFTFYQTVQGPITIGTTSTSYSGSLQGYGLSLIADVSARNGNFLGQLTTNRTNALGAAFYATSTASGINITSSAASQYQYESSTNNVFKTGFYGSSGTTLIAGGNAANVMFASGLVSTSTTGNTNPFITNVGILSPQISSGGATISNLINLYIGPQATAGAATNIYAIYSSNGLVNFRNNAGTQLQLGYDGTNLTNIYTDSTGVFHVMPYAQSTIFQGNVTAGNNLVAGGSVSGGNANFLGSITSYSTTSTSAAFWVTASVQPQPQNVANYQYQGSTTNYVRVGFGGSSSGVLAAGANFSSVYFGNAIFNSATSGSHNWATSVIMLPVSIVTQGGATINNTANLFIGGSATYGVNNYAIYVSNGLNQFNGTTEQLRLAYDSTHYNSFTVDVNGNLNITPNVGNVAIGGNSTSVSNGYELGVVYNPTITTGSSAAFSVQNVATPSATSAATNYGGFFQTGDASANTYTINTLAALGSQIVHRGSGLLSNAYGLSISSPSNTGGGYINGAAGIIILPQTSANVGTGYALISTGTNDISYTMGRWGFGLTNPSSSVTLSATSSDARYITTDASQNYSRLRSFVSGGALNLNAEYSGTAGPSNYIINTNVGLGGTPTANFQVSQSTTGPGYATVTSGSATVTGTNTQFVNTFAVGQTITIGGETHTILSIASNTSLTTTTNWTINSNISAPSGLVATLIPTGGTLPTGPLFYVVTASNASGETIASNEVSVTIVNTISSVTLQWTTIAGATSYRIYRGTSTGNENVYYTTAGVTFTDTNAISTSATPPGTNTAKGQTVYTLIGGTIFQSFGNGTSSFFGKVNLTGGLALTTGSDATGDTYYRNSTGVFARLGIGSTGQILGISSGLPSWISQNSYNANITATDANFTMTLSSGDIVYLPNITATRTAIFPAVVANKLIIIYNQNTSSFSWGISATVVVKNAAGVTQSTFSNQTISMFIGANDASAWLKII